MPNYKRIGTDVNINTCITEGFLVVYPTTRKPIREKCYRFVKYVPDYLTDMPVNKREKIVDIWLSPTDLWERYQDNKEGIDSFVGFKHTEESLKDFGSLVSFAEDIEAYCGLE